MPQTLILRGGVLNGVVIANIYMRGERILFLVCHIFINNEKFQMGKKNLK